MSKEMSKEISKETSKDKIKALEMAISQIEKATYSFKITKQRKKRPWIKR